MAISPLLTGYFFKKSLTALINQYNQNNTAKMKLVAYENGWLQSDFTLQIIPFTQNQTNTNPDLLQLSTITLKANVQHGPLLSHPINKGLTFGIATVNTQIHFDNKVETFLLGAPKPTGIGNIISIVHFDGDWINHLQTIPINMAIPFVDGNVNWQGLKGTIIVRMRGGVVNALKSNLVFGTLNVKLNLEQPIEFTQQPITQITDTKRAVNGLFVGKTLLTFSDSTVKYNGGTLLTIKDFANDTASDDENNHFNLTENLNIAGITVKYDDFPVISPIKLILTLDDINANEIAILFKLLSDQMDTSPIAANFPRLLLPTSRLSLNFSMNSALGELSATSEAHLLNNAPLPQTMDALHQTIQMNTHVKVAAPLATFLVQQYLIVSAMKLIKTTPDNQTTAAENVENPIINKQSFNNAIADMIQAGKLPLNVAIQIMNLYDTNVTPELFAAKIKSFNLSPDTESNLNQLYTQMHLPKQTPNVTAEQTTPPQSAQSLITELLRDGYLIQDNNDYLLNITYDHGVMKINDKEMTPLLHPPVPAGAVLNTQPS